MTCSTVIAGSATQVMFSSALNQPKNEELKMEQIKKEMDQIRKDSVYVRNGYSNRREYLKSLAEEYGEEIVSALSDVMGPSEDFDGLVSELEDWSYMNGF